MHDDYYLGIDAGGTKCRAAVFCRGNVLLGTGVSGPANPVNGLQLAQDSIVQSVYQALNDAGLHQVAFKQLNVGAGIAGLHLPMMQHAMSQWQHPFKSFYCTTDLHAAVTGMHQGRDGGVIILGTGFSALGIVNGVQHAIGGYGFPINAQGSGSWLGLQAIEAVLLAFDGIGPETSMLKAVTQHEGLLCLATGLNQGNSAEFAKFAPLVFEHADQGDLLAKAIIEQATEFLQAVIKRLNILGVTEIVLVGSVAQRLQSRLQGNFAQSIVQGKASTEFGAITLAKKRLAKTEDKK